mmetsp:Transcript_30735/g.77006  ORF Transcript_30735/g.77006 Transcript_30735/m.77006 type:complete len:123 (+) Transcript_30735:219-587(+)
MTIAFTTGAEIESNVAVTPADESWETRATTKEEELEPPPPTVLDADVTTAASVDSTMYSTVTLAVAASLRRLAAATSVTLPTRTAILEVPVAAAKASASLDVIAAFTDAAFKPERVATVVIV